MSGGIQKIYQKQWAIGGYFIYDIYQVIAGNLKWFMAEPKTPGCVTRTTNTEKELRTILENDCLRIIRAHRKQRTR